MDGKVGEPVLKSVDLGNKHGQEVAIIPLLLMGEQSALERTQRLRVCASLIIQTPDINCADCLRWTFKADLKKCYKFYGAHKSWPEARRHCVDVTPGGQLVSIPDVDTQDFLKNQMGDGKFWAGGNIDDKGSWYWLDGTPWSELSQGWREDHPQDGSDQRLYFKKGGYAKWESRPLTEKHGCVCQYDYEDYPN